ncbi:MAG: ComF family protein [Magnetococcus sp. MYC-9]
MPNTLFQRGWSLLRDALFPARCLLCHQEMAQADQLCAACLRQLPAQPENHCLRCGAWAVGVQNGCGHCLPAPEQHADACYFAYLYEGPIARWVVGLKFADRSEWSRLMAGLLWHRLQDVLRWESPDMLVPVPLHPYRLIARRYNQSALLARCLAGWMGIPLRSDLLHRIRRTQPQTHLNAQQRAANVRGAFRAERGLVQGRSVLLVDDVFTTGATTGAAVRALKKAGAGRVAVACLAAVHHGQPDRVDEPSPASLFTG